MIKNFRHSSLSFNEIFFKRSLTASLHNSRHFFIFFCLLLFFYSCHFKRRKPRGRLKMQVCLRVMEFYSSDNKKKKKNIQRIFVARVHAAIAPFVHDVWTNFQPSTTTNIHSHIYKIHIYQLIHVSKMVKSFFLFLQIHAIYVRTHTVRRIFAIFFFIFQFLFFSPLTTYIHLSRVSSRHEAQQNVCM